VWELAREPEAGEGAGPMRLLELPVEAGAEGGLRERCRRYRRPNSTSRAALSMKN
jgi:hypothetical protein